MHILLTDLLRCPRCGPEFGLILLGDRIEERRVLEGRLGCPNCREKYPVEEGFLDLRPPPRASLAPEAGVDGGESPSGAPERGSLERGSPDQDAPDGDEVVRIGALLGVREGPGYVVLTGTAARAAPALAELLEGVEVVAIALETRGWPEAPGISRMATGAILPFATHRMRGVYLGRPRKAEVDDRLDGAMAAVGPGSRLVVEDPPPDAEARLGAAGLDIVLDDAGVLVAQRVTRSG